MERNKRGKVSGERKPELRCGEEERTDEGLTMPSSDLYNVHVHGSADNVSYQEDGGI